MDSNQVSFLQCPLHFQNLIWVLLCIFFHGYHQRLSVTPEIGIVMSKTRGDIPLVGLTHASRGGEAQKFNCGVLMRFGIFHFTSPCPTQTAEVLSPDS
jgi:hypothetical protein